MLFDLILCSYFANVLIDGQIVLKMKQGLFFSFYREFGPKVINLKLVLKQVPVLLEDRDKNVREEGKKLVVELYRWIGQALKPQLSALKPIQVCFNHCLL